MPRADVFGSLLLLLTALIWGAAFLAQKLGMDHVGPFAFTLYRNILAGFCLLAVMALRGQPPRRIFTRANLWAGAWCGLALWVPSMLQQIGITDTSPGTCAFLTANYSLLVPLLALALGKRPGWYVWPGVVLALGGTFLICLKGGDAFALGRGEALTLLCAFFYAIQMMTVDHFVTRPEADVLGISCVQFFTGAVLGLPFLLLPSERSLLTMASIRAGLPAILYCGVFSSGVAYTLQNLGQRRVSASLAGVILSLESVFGVFFGWVGWKVGWMSVPEEMTPRRLVGYGFVFAAVLFTQFFAARRSASAPSNSF